jgi:hypothetical protein
MGLGADILLKIRSTFESKPVEEAKKKTEELGKTADKAGKDGQSGMNVMAAATALMTGNLNGALAAMGPLIEKLKVLKVSLTSITLVGALVGALVKLFTSIRDRAAEAVTSLEGFKADSYERQVAKIESAHARWDAANNKSLGIREAAHQFFIAEQDAYKQEALALNELAKQRELSNAASEDERKIIENKYKSRAEDITGSFDMKVGEKEKERLLQKAKDEEEKIRRNEQTINQKQELAKKRFSDAGEYTRMANEEAGSWYYDSPAKSKTYAGLSDNARGDYSKAMKDAEALRNENEQLKISAEQNRKMASVQDIKNRTIGVSKQAASTATGREASDIQSDIANKAERKRLEDEKDALNRQQKDAEERFGVDKDSAARSKDTEKREMDMAYGVRDSYRKKGDKKGFEAATVSYFKEKAEYEAAEKRAQAVVEDAAKTIKGYSQRISGLEEQIKRIGQ